VIENPPKKGYDKIMRKVLITGCAGFIGSNLADACIEEGWVVHGVDDMSNGNNSFVNQELDLFIRDDFSSDSVKNLISKHQHDVIFHLAAVPRVGYSVEHPAETNDTNVTKTLKLMEMCREKVGRFVFASSSSVYGGTEILPTTEDMPKNPKSPYALQKSVIEDYLTMYGELHEFDSISLRFFNVFGPRALGTSPYATALASWLTAIKQGKPMRSDGDGTQSRDLCFVDNVVDGCIQAARLIPECFGGRFNISSGTRTTNREILSYLLNRYDGSTYVDAPVRPGDVKHTHASFEKERSTFGYFPKVDPWEGIERTCDWYDENWDSIKTFNSLRV